MKWVGNVACLGEIRNSYKLWSRNLKGRDHTKVLDIGGKVIE
jgi:hypothetical protein